jgi:uncharacterized protein YjbI with pentapeptide repeats
MLGAFVPSAYLLREDLRRVNLSRANLTNENLRGAIPTGATMPIG